MTTVIFKSVRCIAYIAVCLTPLMAAAQPIVSEPAPVEETDVGRMETSMATEILERAAEAVSERQSRLAAQELSDLSDLERFALSDSLATRLAFDAAANGLDDAKLLKLATSIKTARPDATRKILRELGSAERAFVSKSFLVNPYMIGGRDTDEQNFPWIVSIGVRPDPDGQFVFICGGTRVSLRYVITAAHCIDGNGFNPGAPQLRNAAQLVVSHGSSRPLGGQLLTVLQLHPHKQWKAGNLPYEFDIAVLEIEPAGTTFQPVSIGNSYVDDSIGRLWAGGWGLVNNSNLASTLQTGKISVRNQVKCTQEWALAPRPGAIRDTMLCAGNTLIGACRGDSGGPLLAGSRERVQLVGVVSWGSYWCSTADAEAYLPEVFTRVSAVTEWLAQFEELRPLINDTKPEPLFEISFPDM